MQGLKVSRDSTWTHIEAANGWRVSLPLRGTGANAWLAHRNRGATTYTPAKAAKAFRRFARMNAAHFL